MQSCKQMQKPSDLHLFEQHHYGLMVKLYKENLQIMLTLAPLLWRMKCALTTVYISSTLCRMLHRFQVFFSIQGGQLVDVSVDLLHSVFMCPLSLFCLKELVFCFWGGGFLQKLSAASLELLSCCWARLCASCGCLLLSKQAWYLCHVTLS